MPAPTRWGERVIQYLFKPARLVPHGISVLRGRTTVFGALGVSTSQAAYVPRTKSPLPRLEQAQHLSEIVRKVSARAPVSNLETPDAQRRRQFSAGAKPKALIEIGAVQWVIKFFDNEPVDAPLIVHASMTPCQAGRIQAAETQVVSLAGEHALAVRRYDREGLSAFTCISAGTALRAQTIAGQEPGTGLPEPGSATAPRRCDGRGPQTCATCASCFARMVFNNPHRQHR